MLLKRNNIDKRTSLNSFIVELYSPVACACTVQVRDLGLGSWE